MDTSKTCLIIGGILLLALAIYYFQNKKQNFSTKKESYMSAGSIDHLDSLDARYELIQSPDAAVPAEHFADLVDSGDQCRTVQQPPDTVEHPLERLEKIQGKCLLPMTAAHLPQYNIDVANPATYSFAVNAPRVVLKNRLNMQGDMLRGDIAIRYFPDIPLIAKSSHGRDSWKGDGFFSDHFATLYNKLTGRSYKNMPLRVASQGTALDYISE